MRLTVSLLLIIGLCSCSQDITIPGKNNNTSQAFEGVKCGELKCPKGQTCHYFSKNKPMCIGKEGVLKNIQENDRGSASVECDGPEDCDAPKECAYMIRATSDYSVMLLCTDKRDPSWDLVCHTDKDCPATHPICKAVKTNYMDSFSRCSEK